MLLTALRDDNGHLIGFAKITRDLSERRRAETAMRDSEERFRLLVQSVRDYAIFMLDPSGHITTWNDGAERIKGYRAEEIIGRHFSIFYPPEDIATDKPARELASAIGLTSFIKHKEITGLFTATTASLMGGTSITEAHISTLA